MLIVKIKSQRVLRHTTLAAALAAISFAHAADGRYIVAGKPGQFYAMRSAVQQRIKAAPAKSATTMQIVKESTAGNYLVMKLDAAAAANLAKTAGVEFVEPDQRRYLFGAARKSVGVQTLSTSDTPAQTAPYGIALVKADQVPYSGPANRKVCIIDSGYDNTHEDLITDPKLLTGDNDPDGTGDWYDVHGGGDDHGTHVAGTIAALDNNKGVVGVMGKGNLKLHIIKVFKAGDWVYSSDLVGAVDKCIKADANIINMSLGGGDPSRLERRAFDEAAARGVLSIAAAGNDGDHAIPAYRTAQSYPASYLSVISVGAVDSRGRWAGFSQYNNRVDISAPGVAVMSTIPPEFPLSAALTVNGAAYDALPLTNTKEGDVTGLLADCGLGKTECSASGQVCLIQRGEITFKEKVQNCEAGGGIAAVVYNNREGDLNGTLGDDAASIKIPAIGIRQNDGKELLGKLGMSSKVTVKKGAPVLYGTMDGTSMATPHVAGVAALIWSHVPTASARQVKNALLSCANDLGAPGRDNKYGHGLVDAKRALNYLRTGRCD